MTAVDELRDVDYTAELLHLDRVTVLRYARRGLIGSVLIGRKRFFRDPEIQAFIDSRARPAQTAAAPAPVAAPSRPSRNPNRTYRT